MPRAPCRKRSPHPVPPTPGDTESRGNPPNSCDHISSPGGSAVTWTLQPSPPVLLGSHQLPTGTPTPPRNKRDVPVTAGNPTLRAASPVGPRPPLPTGPHHTRAAHCARPDVDKVPSAEWSRPGAAGSHGCWLLPFGAGGGTEADRAKPQGTTGTRQPSPAKLCPCNPRPGLRGGPC